MIAAGMADALYTDVGWDNPKGQNGSR